MTKQGNIGVTTENIFPIIKKFLYSDHEIFLREIVSNAVDATQKLKTLAAVGDFKGDLGDLSIRITLNEKAGTLTVSDHGIGMTEEEIEKYINRIAFSGAEEFVAKYNNNAADIIGHFGLGFYSAFMVAKKVVIVTRSCQNNATPMKWTCLGNPEYDLSETNKDSIGTDVILYIDDDNKEFLSTNKINDLLTKYCRFLPIPIVFGKKQEWKDGKFVDTPNDNIINITQPAWTRKPADLSDNDYKEFYQTLYPLADEPLFWIHLNVDFPFHLTGILYFPRINKHIDPNRNKIQLFANQVFVTDSVEGIVPDFLTLLHGVLDSPDIPLNVSRSYLQSDSNVKKLSAHIAKKVADKLEDIFKTDRPQFESKWDSLKVFIHYGMLSDDKFYQRALNFALLTDSDNHAFTLNEYQALIQPNQTDKDGQTIFLYTHNPDEHFAYIQAAKNKGLSILLLNGPLDNHLIALLEQKLPKTRFRRIDSDTTDQLIPKPPANNPLSEKQQSSLKARFQQQLPSLPNTAFQINIEPLGNDAPPIILTQNEYTRRLRDMAAFQPEIAALHNNNPDNLQLTLNANHPIITQLLPNPNNDNPNPTNTTTPDNATPSDNPNATSTPADNNATRIQQLIDLALLSAGILKGEHLNRFIDRSLQSLP